ncbi:two-component system response regulator YesN [Paenibacillus endophyticus]|uniref:Two-component system response regulator YesN n=1 Tax=Paenibacillus endophyticus TaxID=1294268 RepID=A0A7W5C4M0_9BACL|nr:response regulator [Paenibacillus endophyticus]MBB3150584.1 two-component system response regulator YesN [Paenibacillus endophyticus]
MMHKVFLVDDESWVVESLKDLVDWGSYGFEVVGQAYNGMAALEAIAEVKPDVVFTDIRMPEMNGLELIQRGRAFPFPVQFVIVSGYAEFAYAQKAISQGAVAYCLKPFDEVEISSVLARLNKQLRAAKPVFEPSLIHLIDEPSLENEWLIRDRLERDGVLEQGGDSLLAVISVGPEELPMLAHGMTRMKIGTAKTAYLVQARLAAAVRNEWERNRPESILGIGMSDSFDDLKEIKRAIENADVLAHQYFVSGEVVAVNSGVQPESGAELNEWLLQVSHAIQERNLESAMFAMDRIGGLFTDNSLTVKHALKVYHMTVSFLFGLGETESMLYSYEQLVKSFDHLSSMLGELKMLLTKYLTSTGASPVETKNPTVNSILHYVALNFRRDISLQDLSEQFFMNPSYISQLFKKEVGETLTAHMAKLRIAYACELLDSEAGSIQDIAEKIGYHDYFYFTRIFKKMTGKTPTQYREKQS